MIASVPPMPCVPVSSSVARVVTQSQRVTIEAKAYRAIWAWSQPRVEARGRWTRVY